ncbi:unnamed protein product [Moneuplotes crassus]|uniref:Uncharacterized protein n=1 Tax=Euplotes crassus TaxID=5936 RepID=A0AAD1Y251_EUPCR|nr:unnamed protein product [Moneuplotes crassus]
MEKVITAFELENKMRDAVKILVEPFLQRETYLCNEVELLKIKIEKHDAKVIEMESFSDRIRYLEHMNAGTQKKFQTIDDTLTTQNGINNERFEDQYGQNKDINEKIKDFHQLFEELEAAINAKARDHRDLTQKLILMRGSINEDIAKTHGDVKKLVDQVTLRVDFLSNEKDSLSFHLNNQKKLLSEIETESEKVRQEMEHFKSLLQPILTSTVTKKEFLRQTEDIRIDMKYLVGQMGRFKKDIDKINQEHKQKLQEGILTQLSKRVEQEISDQFTEVKAEVQKMYENQQKQALLKIESNAQEQKQNFKELKELIRKEINMHIERSMEYAKKNFLFDSGSENDQDSDQEQLYKDDFEASSLRKGENIDEESSQSVLSKFNSMTGEAEIEVSKISHPQKDTSTKFHSKRVAHPTPQRANLSNEDISLSQNISFQSNAQSIFDKNCTSQDFLIKSTLTNCVDQIALINSKIETLNHQYRKAKLIISNVARKIECDDRLSTKIQKYPNLLKSAFMSHCVRSSEGSPQEILLEDKTQDELIAQISASIVQSEETCITMSKNATDKLKIMIEAVNTALEELQLDFEHWKRKRYKERREIKAIVEGVKEDIWNNRKDTVDASLSPFRIDKNKYIAKSIIDTQEVREIFVKTKKKARASRTNPTSSLGTRNGKNSKIITARASVLESLRKINPAFINKSILTLRKLNLRNRARNATSQEQRQRRDLSALKNAPLIRMKLNDSVESMNKTLAPNTAFGLSTESISTRNKGF